MTPAIHVDRAIDAKGMMCPMPVLTLARTIKELASGQVISISVTDEGARRDIPAWAEKTGNTLLDMTEENGILTFYVRKA